MLANINIGDIISIKHSSGLLPFRSYVIKTGKNTLKIRLLRRFAVKNFYRGDKVLFLNQTEQKQMGVIGCVVSNVSRLDGSIELWIDSLPA